MRKYDKIVCINNDNSKLLILNKVYTVENYLDHNDNCVPQILLQEIDSTYYKAERFIGLRELRKQKLKKIKDTIGIERN